MAQTSSRTSIISTARNLMLHHGYAATSVDDICSTAKVTKGSFYHYFESKEAVAIAVLNAFYDEGISRLINGPYVDMSDSKSRLLSFFDHLETIGPELWRDGCLIGNFACEFAESSPVIRRRVAAMFDALVKQLAPLFEPVAKEGEGAAELAEYTLMVIEGAVVMARAHADPSRISSALRILRGTIEARIGATSKEGAKANHRR
ncbi:MAG TPA: TetR/AcrR family transcriptional regulator [Candidatus Binataceae bacterium]|nr:TetR/AcrR family transcriptional regulator [Candidatus Binataceae bacterium]